MEIIEIIIEEFLPPLTIIVEQKFWAFCLPVVQLKIWFICYFTSDHDEGKMFQKSGS